MQYRVLRLHEVKAATGLGRSTIYAQQAAGEFPPSFALGERAVGWLSNEIAAVLNARATGATSEAIRGLVASLVEGRRGAIATGGTW